MNDTLTQIGRGESCPFKERLLAGPQADKFFAVGSILGFLGTAWLGAHLWLMLQGAMTPAKNFQNLKQLHVLIQMHGFVGLFVLGFLVQAGGKILDVKAFPWPMTILYLPVILLGLTFEWISPNHWIAALLVGSPYIIEAARLVRLARDAPRIEKLRMLTPIAMGLLITGIGPFFDLRGAFNALFVLWFGLGMVVLATCQQFITGVFKGNRLSLRSTSLVAISSLASAISLFQAPELFGVFTLTTLLIFMFGTRLYLAVHFVHKQQLALPFLIAFLWAVVASVRLIQLPYDYDGALHILALGWMVTLILPVSLQIVGMLASKPLLSLRNLTMLLLLWQIVPIARGLRWTPLLGVFPSFTMSVIATFVIGLWSWKIIAHSIRHSRHRL